MGVGRAVEVWKIEGLVLVVGREFEGVGEETA